MKTKIILFILLLSCNFLQARDLQGTVLSRYRDYLLSVTPPAGPANITQWTHTLNEQGRWPDIDYHDSARANWQLLNHLKRIRGLAIAWSDPKTSFYHSEEVWQAINAALDDWLKNRYKNPNWWHNQIGVPQYMRDIVTLLNDKLAPERRKQALQVMAQLQVQKNGAGANLIWSADLGFHYGLLTGDTALMDCCRQLIINEIHISTGEGVQPDFSFHQHGNRLQMYQYGKAFLFATVRFAWELRGTRLALPQDKIKILTGFLLRGWQWMARGVNTVPGTMDRSATRIGELRSPDIRPLIPLLCELSPENAAAFKTIAAHQNGKGALEGYRYYPYADFTAYQNEDFSFFVKTISVRTAPTEVGLNSENLKGRLLNSGDAYLIKNGEEYYNLMPVWDWQKLPGITGFKDAYGIERRPFVGDVSDGESGLSAMDYCMENKAQDQQLSAHKVWACHKNTVVCLIAGMEAAGIHDKAYTVLDQCRLQGEVTVNSPGNVIKEGTHKLTGVQWIHHKNSAYMPLKPATIELTLGKVSGTWSSINASQSDSLVTDKIFMPVMMHDPQANGSSAGYVLAFCKTPRRAMKLSRKPAWDILRNDKDCQAVRFEDGLVTAAFFSAGSLELPAHQSLTVDKPCLVLIAGDALYASDPSHKGETVNMQLDAGKWQMALPADGTTARHSLP